MLVWIDGRINGRAVLPPTRQTASKQPRPTTEKSSVLRFRSADLVVGASHDCILTHKSGCVNVQQRGSGCKKSSVLDAQGLMTSRSTSSLSLSLIFSISLRPRPSLPQARRHFKLAPLFCPVPSPGISTSSVAAIRNRMRSTNISGDIGRGFRAFRPSAPTFTQAAMAQSNAIDQLAQRVDGLTLQSLAQKYPTASFESNPLDLYRAHLSNVLSEISGVDTSIIYPVVMLTQSLDKGDFVVAVPALRIKGSKPDVLAQEWAAKVRLSWQCQTRNDGLLVDNQCSTVPRERCPL